MRPVEFNVRRYRSRPAPQGRRAEPSTGTGHASRLLIVTVGTTRDSEPLLPSPTRTGARRRTRSRARHDGVRAAGSDAAAEGRIPRRGGT